MGQAVLRIQGLPGTPLDAATEFHRAWLPQARDACQTGDVALVFAPAGHEHRAWRLAAVQALAREAAPRRANAVVGEGDAVEHTVGWLARAPGITGQLLAVD